MSTSLLLGTLTNLAQGRCLLDAPLSQAQGAQ